MYDEIISQEIALFSIFKELSTNDKVSIDKLLKVSGVKSA